MSDDITIGSNPKEVERDQKLTQRAMNKRWPIPEKTRAALVERMTKFALDENLDPDRSMAATRLLMAGEGQNQADDHLREKNERLDEGKSTENVNVRTVKVTFDSNQ